MAAAYDNYDYPSYWLGREYEHECEVIAIRSYLEKVPKIKKVLDIGCGFGRLTPYYAFRSKRIFLSDPSSRLLKEAKNKLSQFQQKLSKKDITYIHSSVENLPKRLKNNKFDLIFMVRVMHHLENPDKVFSVIDTLLTPNGYLILEFANKMHIKAITQNFLKGNFTFPLDIFPSDRKTKKKENTIPFLNYHPDVIKDLLKKHSFKIIEERSVSNIRSTFMKKYIPIPVLVELEKYIQKPFSKFSAGPSIFLLCRKKG